MSSYKALNRLISILMVLSLLFNGSVGIIQVSAQGASSPVGNSISAMPMDPTDESKVPHYFGPYPNWANSPLTVPNATVEIQGDGSGATAVAQVNSVTLGIDAIQITSPGSGYTHANVVITGGNSDATATATINTTGIIASVNVDVSGAGYTAPAVTFSGGGATADATGTAYGSVDAIAIIDGGFGYTMPTVDFDLPDDPNGVQAKAHAVMDGNGTIIDVVLDDPGSGYLNAPKVVIHDGTLFDPIAGATPATVSATLKVTSVVLDTFGNGYTSAPTVAFSDTTGTGTGASATAVVDIGGVTGIQVTNPGSGYLTVGMRKFIDDLPGLCAPPACPATGKYIPLAVADPKNYNGIEADEYEIGLIQYRTSFSSDLPLTLVRGYVQLETPANRSISQHVELFNELLDGTQVSTGYFGVTAPQWLGPVIAATKNKPVRIVFRNLLPTGSDGDLFLPADSSLMGSGMGPMNMGMPMNDGTVMDDVRNPPCSEYPKSDDCFKDNRATLHLHGGTTPWISDGTAHQWITPANQTTPWPQGVGVTNVPDMGAAGCDGDRDGCMTFYYTNQQSARLLFYHDHAWGITRLNVYAGEAAGYLISDDAEKALLASGTIPAEQIPLIVQDRTFVPDAAQLALQDPTWDVARWGSKGSFWYHHVYMPAQNPGDPSGMSAYGRWMYGPWFWPPAADTMYGPIDNPYYNSNCKLDDPATWQYQTDPFCEPKQIPGTPNISVGMEQFNDTPIVNGVAYPKITLEPKAYRMRILNAANDRFFNFQWYVADSTQGNGLTEVALKQSELDAAQTDPNVFPTPDTSRSPVGPSWIQIGTEGGFLPAPVVIPNQPITWITDPTRFDVGNVDQHSLLLAPAERADVIVDFSKYAGKTLILYNDAPAAFPARVASYDYYTGAPDLSPVGAPTILPGYGPNTRTIMQVTISGTAAPAFNLTKLRNAFKHNANGTGVFESGQHPIIVGQSAYNSAYGTSFAPSSNCNAPGSTLQRCDGLVRVNDTQTFGFNTLRAPNVKMTMPLQPKAIHDEMNATTFDEYGRMQANLGVEAQPPTPGQQNVTLYPFVNPGTEFIDATNLPKAHIVYDANTGLPVSDFKITPIGNASDGTQIWRITHNGVDTHPIHFHLYDVQLLNRVTWDNIIIPPDPNELGWKDTVRISPLEDTIVALRPIIPEVPWELPNSIRMLNPMMPAGSEAMFHNFDPQGNPTSNIVNQLVNFGWEYVYHCHILSHEEMDMMRPVSVALPPIKPDGLAMSSTGTLTWNDNSITETSFVVQRMDSSLIWQTLTTIPSPLDQPNTHGPRSYTDPGYVDGNSYQYRVIARNTVGYGAEFPTLTVQSVSDILVIGNAFPPDAPSNLVATVVAGPKVNLQWTDNALTETGFTIERAPVVNGVIGTFAAIDGVGANVTTYSDLTVAGNTADTSYAYRVFAFNLAGNSLPTDPPATVTVPAPPAVASIVRASANPTGAATVNYTVTFSKAVTGVDATDFAFALTGSVAGTSVKSVSGSGKTYTVAVNTGSGSGTLGLNLVDNDTIIDALSNPLGSTGLGNGNFTGELYTLNRVVPTVVSIVANSPSPTNALSVAYTVTFSEAVTGVDKTDFALALTGNISGASVATVSGSGAIYTVSVNTGTGSGTLGLNLVDNDTILSVAANNPLGGTGAGNGNFTGDLYTIIKTIPVVQSIVVVSPNPTNVLSVDYTVTFSEPVTGVDATDFVVAPTGNIAGASITNVTPVSTTVYTVTVDTGSGSGTLGLNVVDDDTIVSVVNIPLGDVGLGNGNFTGDFYTIDKTGPTAQSIVTALANPTKADSVDYTVTFSEPVTGVDATDFVSSASAGILGASVTSVTPVSTTVYTVTVNTGSGTGTLGVNLVDDDTIIDALGNPLGNAGLGNGNFTGDLYTVDRTAPTVASIVTALANPTNALSVDYTVTFSESVTGVDAADFALNPAGGVSGASITGVSGTGATYTVTVNTGTGSGTLGLDVLASASVIDQVGNAIGSLPFSGGIYTIDKIAPTVVSVVRASANPTFAASVDYTVTFSEPVTGLDTADFAITITGASVASVASVNGSGTTYTVSVNNGTGRGTLRLDISGTASITDLVGNALGGLPFTGGEVYTTLPVMGAGIYDDADPAWTYAGTWLTSTGTGPVNNTLHYANASNTTATFVFQGPSRFVLTYTAASNRGNILVSVDGGAPVTINAYSTTTRWQRTYSSALYSDSGRHTVTVSTPGDGKYVDVDAIQVVAAPTPMGIGSYDDTNATWSYLGSWTAYTGSGPSGNTMHYANASNASATFAFQAPARFVLTYTAASNRGNMLISVDGGAPVTINAYSATTLWQRTYASALYSDTGIHTVTITTPGDGKYVDVDAIQILDIPTAMGVGTYDDADAAWTYSGTWTVYTGAGPANGTMHYTNASNASATFAFQGPGSFMLTYTAAANRGNILVSVDGGAPVSINAYSATTVWQRTYISPAYPAGTHIITISTPANGTYIDVDAIQIFNGPPTVGGGIYDDTHPAWTFSAGWTTYTGSGPYNGTNRYTNVVGSDAQLTFTGTKFTLTYVKASNRGLIDVYVDGAKVGTINANSGVTTWQATWTSSTLTAGTHTVRFVHAGGGTYIDVDAITITP